MKKMKNKIADFFNGFEAWQIHMLLCGGFCVLIWFIGVVISIIKEFA